MKLYPSKRSCTSPLQNDTKKVVLNIEPTPYEMEVQTYDGQIEVTLSINTAVNDIIDVKYREMESKVFKETINNVKSADLLSYMMPLKD